MEVLLVSRKWVLNVEAISDVHTNWIPGTNLTFHVQPHLHVEELFVEVRQVPIISVTCVVHKDVDFLNWAGRDRGIHKSLAPSGIGYVALHGNRLGVFVQSLDAIYDIFGC